ncbi:MAG TPA: hypothetical protein VFS29_12460 [Motilibacteraceae bacterium]|nr:hypothetical protein [Motilibacteraceae bacterium]
MTSPSPASARALALLAAGVPLSLLCDLAEPDGPRSREIVEAEREGSEAWWWELAYPSGAVRGTRGRTA